MPLASMPRLACLPQRTSVLDSTAAFFRLLPRSLRASLEPPSQLTFTPQTSSTVTRPHGMLASSARSSMPRASPSFIANSNVDGMMGALHRVGASARACGTYNSRSMNALPHQPAKRRNANLMTDATRLVNTPTIPQLPILTHFHISLLTNPIETRSALLRRCKHELQINDALANGRGSR